jgi:hypothetical protein
MEERPVEARKVASSTLAVPTKVGGFYSTGFRLETDAQPVHLHLGEERKLIKAHYGPATEDLVEQVLAKISPELAAEPDFAAKVHTVIGTLKHELGYEITIEVEVHGDMAKALESVNDGSAAAGAVRVERPKRKE